MTQACITMASGAFALQQQAPSSIQVGNSLPSSHGFGWLTLARSNKFDSMPCSTSSVGPSIEVASADKDIATCNTMPSKAEMVSERQATEIDVALHCLQVLSNHFQDHAFTDACKQGGGREFTVRVISKDTCKHLPNIQTLGSDTVGSAPWFHALIHVAYNEEATGLPPPDASALEPSQVPTARCKNIASLADTPPWRNKITFISTLSLVANNWL